MNNRFFTVLNLILSLLLSIDLLIAPIYAQTLQSNTYKINDANINNTSQILTSTNFSMLGDISNLTSDARLISGSYELQSGFPNGTLANVPLIKCFETITDNTNSNCLNLPNNWGTKGECGYGGCFDRAKLEIDNQLNPFDSLYLTKLIDNTDNTVYYLQSDHTLSLTYDINDFLTICSLEGRDLNDPNCDQDTDPNWDIELQRFNILGLNTNTTYSISIAALNGDFTGTEFSPEFSAQTGVPSIFFDLNIGLESNPNVISSAPYEISLGDITYSFPVTATDLIWMNIGINTKEGLSVFVHDSNDGLLSSATNTTIPSQTEDLNEDTGNNGGYGLKTYNFSPSQTFLGPLKRSTTYDTSTGNSVGAVSSNNTIVFSTNTIDGTQGRILEGKGALYLKARSTAISPASSDYRDILTFIIVGNF